MNNTITTTRACSECTFWNELDGSKGECRRHAPQMIAFEVDEEVQFESKFPITLQEDWCGDFERIG